MVDTTAFYAALLAFGFLAISRNVIVQRRRRRIAIGDQGDADLLRRIRVQGNFAEYVPFALLLLALAEIQGLAPIMVHALGLMLLVGRLLHAIGVSRTAEDFRFRVAGMGLTFGVLVLAALANLFLSVKGLLVAP